MARIIPVAVFDCVVFGATGDLTLRKLLPALYYRFRDGQMPPESRVIGAARSDLGEAGFRDRARGALEEHVTPADLEATRWSASARSCITRSWTRHSPAGTGRCWGSCSIPRGCGCSTSRRRRTCTARSVVTSAAPAWSRPQSRVVLEKPIGHDLESARRINDEVGAVFEEAQIFRIDHFLGKETVQNLLALRFANTIFERLWTADDIDHVQITVAETVGLEGRAGYYDHAGALRDMVQNHLLQLLCLIAMEPPVSLDADRVRDEKLKVLRALGRSRRTRRRRLTVRGQYAQGAIDGRPVPGYVADLGNGGSSPTETFVALKAEV